MIIRGATEKDLPCCESLLKLPEFEFYEGGYPDAGFLKNYLEKDYFLVAEEDEKIIGCIIGEPLKANGVIIWYFVIDRKLRGGGIGKMLISAFEKKANENGKEWILLQCPLDSEDSKNFYRKRRYNEGKPMVEFEKEFK